MTVFQDHRTVTPLPRLPFFSPKRDFGRFVTEAPMRVVCPHAGEIAPETAESLDESGLSWDSADVSGSDTAYSDLLGALWASQADFTLVEHDIVPFPGALVELSICPEPWCAYRYDLAGGLHAGLGCTKFAGKLTGRFPDAVTRTWRESNDVHPAGHWCNLDDRLTAVLTSYGVARHVHEPIVTHLRPQPSHGCV